MLHPERAVINSTSGLKDVFFLGLFSAGILWGRFSADCCPGSQGCRTTCLTAAADIKLAFSKHSLVISPILP